MIYAVDIATLGTAKISLMFGGSALTANNTIGSRQDSTVQSDVERGIMLATAQYNEIVGEMEQEQLIAEGVEQLLAGEMPSDAQLAAMGKTKAEALGDLAVLQMNQFDDADGYQTSTILDQGAETSITPLHITLKYKEGWTEAQKAEADAKVKALSEAKTVKTPVVRRGTSASARYKVAYGESAIPRGYDIDHTIDLQLGGTDDISNLKPLNKSVNRSLGKQVQRAIKDYPDNTEFGSFTIH